MNCARDWCSERGRSHASGWSIGQFRMDSRRRSASASLPSLILIRLYDAAEFPAGRGDSHGVIVEGYPRARVDLDARLLWIPQTMYLQP